MAAPVFDAAASGSVASATSLTFAHTCTGADRLLLVTAANAIIADVSGVTYGGVAMTYVADILRGDTIRIHLFRLIAPATGANDVIITLVSGATAIVGGSQSFTGAHQTTPLGTPATASGYDTAPSIAVSSATGELVADAVGTEPNNAPTVGAGQTERWNLGVGTTVRAAGSTEPGAASVTMSWTLGATQRWVIIGVSIKPAAAGGSVQQNLLLVGVGS